METAQIADVLAGLTLFADLKRAELEAATAAFTEKSIPAGQRVLRQGSQDSGFYVILEGEAQVVIDGEERARLARGDYFGEISSLLGQSPSADVIAASDLRCLLLRGEDLEQFLTGHPAVTYRVLQAQARRLRSANSWRS